MSDPPQRPADPGGRRPLGARRLAICHDSDRLVSCPAGDQRRTVYAKEAGVVVARPADARGEPSPRFARPRQSGLRECLAGLQRIEELPLPSACQP